MQKRILILVLGILVAATLLIAGCSTPTSPPPGTVTPTVTAPPQASIPPEILQYAKDWPLPNRDYQNSRATTDSSINSGNVQTLRVAWSFPINGVGTFGGAQSNPLIMGDVVYFQDASANVFALNRTTGDVIWAYTSYNKSVSGPNGPAMGYGKVYFARDPYNMAAVDAATGTGLWSRNLSPKNTTGIDIAPSVYNSRVYTSTVPGTGDLFYAGGGIGVLYALDVNTGQIAWNFSTVDSPDIWGNPTVNSGGGCWYSPAIDTATGDMYWGTGNPAPFPGTREYPNGASRPGPNLYTNCMLALNSANGNLKWYTQTVPHDIFDYDFQISPILTRANINGRDQDIVIGAGKMGRVFAFNRDSGAILWVADVGTHNGNDQLAALPPNTTTRILPGTLGGVETPMAYADGIVYVPWNDRYSEPAPTDTFPNLRQQPFINATGGITAIEANTGKVVWNKPLSHLNIGSAMVVNDLVFTATFEGTIYAFNKDTGEQVWTFTAPGGINAWPAAAGDTILWPVGLANPPQLIALRLSGS